MNFLISEEDWNATFGYLVFIQKQAALGNKIPAKVINKFFSFFKFTVYNDPDIKKQAEEKAQTIINKFPELHFSGKKERESPYYIEVTKADAIPKNDSGNEEPVVRISKEERDKDFKASTEIVDYDFKEIIQSLSYILELLSYEKELSKDECIQIAYNRVVEFKRIFLNEKQSKEFTEFKIGVLCSFVAVIFGFMVSSKKLTSEVLFDASRNAINKAKRKAAQSPD